MIHFEYFKVTDEMVYDKPILYEVIKSHDKDGYFKGYIYRFISLKTGRQNEDFVNSLTTFVIKYNVIKVSRIFKTIKPASNAEKRRLRNNSSTRLGNKNGRRLWRYTSRLRRF